MLRNNLKIAWRNILKNKLFSLINVIGLSIGICAAMVIGSIVYYDLSFDRFHKDGDKIFRITTVFKTKEREFSNRGVALTLMRTFREGVAGVEIAAPFFNTGFHRVENRDAALKFKNSEDAIFADGAYFELFEYSWLAGDAKTALSQPYRVVLAKAKAEKYFPHTPLPELLGRTLVYNDSIPVTVSGIVAPLAGKTDLNFDEFMSLSSSKGFNQGDLATDDEWDSTSSSHQFFIKVRDKASLPGIQARLDALALEHKSTEPWALENEQSYALQALSELHFEGENGNFPFDNSEHVASKKVLKSLALVALFLLLLGCANFINLNSAQALTRAKEIGIRKTLGSSKRQVILQFLGETFILTLLAALLSLILAPLLLNRFADFLPADIDLSPLYSAVGMSGILLLILLVSLVSGFYPAFVLSKFKPVSVLKGQFSKGDKGVRLRKTLTVFQFVVAQVFVIATLLVGKQLYFAMNRDTGIKTEAIAHINTPWNDRVPQKRERLFDQIKEINGLTQVSWGNRPPTSNSVNSTLLTHFKDGAESHQSTEMLWGDLDYLKTYGIPIIAGRERLNDSIREYVVNETLARTLGYQDPGEMVGTTLKWDTLQIPVVGVMRDFNQRSLRSVIKPMALTGNWSHGRSNFNNINFDLGSTVEQWPKTIEAIERAWASVYPEEEFQVHFMEETLKGFYHKERSTVQLLGWATGLAILISCLGLLGLAVYTTERRVKEIGIRKVLGANLTQLNLLLCRESLILVGLAFVISVPISYYLLEQWMQDFAYRTSMSWWVFLLSGLGMLAVALITLMARTHRSANTNPVECLRTE